MRPFVLLLLSPLTLPLQAATDPDALQPAQAACTETERLNDRRELTCRVPAAPAGTVYRFRATFTGGHDDTAASLAPLLDDRPLECEPASKTRLFGEDGDVSLHCDFKPATPGRASVLKVLVKWSHADYADHELGPIGP